MLSEIKIDPSWNPYVQKEFDKPYFNQLDRFLKQEERLKNTTYPPSSEIFSALQLTPFNAVKVVILGQDPYHGIGQAHGLSFSVKQGVTLPPSLRNIFKELKTDIPQYSVPLSGDLSHWAKQGVLLLNATLTVAKDKPGSHQGKGWEEFTDELIRQLSKDKSNIVFLLWGKFAQSKSILIDAQKHFILTAAHPSPFSAYKGFLGCKHFSLTNDFLRSKGLSEIQW
jgi:uracil-DNA glycosylase